MKKIFLSPWLSLLTLSLIIGLRISDPSFIESIRLRYFDTLIKSIPSHESENLYIANIDDKALGQYGQYPFPRYIISDIIENLYQHGSALVVSNIIYSEPDRFGGDLSLQQTLKKYPVVLSKIPINEKYIEPILASKESKLPEKPRKQIPGCNNHIAGVSVIGDNINDWIVKYPSILTNLNLLEDCAVGSGVTNTFPEIDGVTRRIPTIISVYDILYPNLALETLRVVSGDPSFQIKVNESGIQAVRIPQFKTISTDSIGRVWLSWNSKIPEFSITNIPDLTGKIVILGLTAKGLSNPVATSIGSQYPHYLQGALIDTLINGYNISRPDWTTVAEIGFTLLLSIISILLIRWKYGFIPVLIGISSLYFIGNYIFNEYKILIDITIPTITIFGVYAHSFTVKFITELNAKLQIKKQFGGYVSPIMVERLQQNPDLIKLGGEKKELSIVMTDLRGFTTLGESFGDDVEGLTQIMNDYMTAISEPVLHNDGCIIKFIGDASLHIHGAPLDDEFHAKHAVKTGLDMINAVERFNAQLKEKGRPPIGMGVGINTGETLIGNIGSKWRFGYDVLGDSVSTAARLEGQTKPYGVLLIIGQRTAELIKDDYFTLELDRIAVKGKKQGVTIFTVLDIDLSSSLDYILTQQKHDSMLEEYRNKNWIKASILCNELIGEFDSKMDNYYKMLLERISEYQKTNLLPKDWDGVYRSQIK